MHRAKIGKKTTKVVCIILKRIVNTGTWEDY